VRWCAPIISAMQEAEIQKIKVPGQAEYDQNDEGKR
jgi:hypothetical protein